MVLIIIAALLVLGVTLFQAIQGLFSAMIMSILTVLCAVLAFNFYEPLAQALLYSRQPATADAIMLVAMFVVPLLVLRILFDRFLGKNVVLNIWVSRVGGSICGLITALVTVGVLTVAVQMLPVSESFLYYRPFDGALKRSQRITPFYPDEFTVGMVNVLSAGGLSAPDSRFEAAHDDLLLELFCARNTASKGGSVDALPDSMDLLGVWDPEDDRVNWLRDVPPNPLMSTNDISNAIIVRVSVAAEARDEDQWWRLPGSHFRLTSKSGQSYWPVAYLSNGPEGWQVHGPKWVEDRPQIAELIVERPHDKTSRKVTVDWVYRIPSDQEPAAVTFRRVVVQRIGKVVKNSLPPAAGALDRRARPTRRSRSRQQRSRR